MGARSESPEQDDLTLSGIICHDMVSSRRWACNRELLSPVDSVPHPRIVQKVIKFSTEQNDLAVGGIIRHRIPSSWRWIRRGKLLRPVHAIPDPCAGEAVPLSSEEDDLGMPGIVSH